MNCDRNIYSCDILTTRKLFGKRDNKRTNLAFKMSLSFSPDDNDKLTYEEVFNIAKEFAERFFDGYQVMFAVHTDKPHIETGKAYRRSQKDLQTMCDFFGEQCMKRGLTKIGRGREGILLHTGTDDKRNGTYPQGVRTITQKASGQRSLTAFTTSIIRSRRRRKKPWAS